MNKQDTIIFYPTDIFSFPRNRVVVAKIIIAPRVFPKDVPLHLYLAQHATKSIVLKYKNLPNPTAENKHFTYKRIGRNTIVRSDSVATA